MRRKGLVKFSLQEIIEKCNIFESELAVYEGVNVKGVLTYATENIISPLIGKLDFYISEKFNKNLPLNLLIENNHKIYPSVPVSRIYVEGEISFYWNWPGVILPETILFDNQKHFLFKELGICGWGDLKHVPRSKSQTKREWRKSGLKINTTIKYKI